MNRSPARNSISEIPGSRPGTGVARVVGIGAASLVVLMVLIGQGLFLVQSVRSGTWTTQHVAVARTGTLKHRIDVTLAGALGGSDRGVPRFVVTQIRRDGAGSRLRVVRMRWSINNDLSAGTVGNGGQADVYAILRDLYTARLPLARVDLTGTYPMPSGGHMRETVVMRLGISRSTASVVTKAGWDTFDPQTFWPLVTRYYVDPQLQPLPPG